MEESNNYNMNSLRSKSGSMDIESVSLVEEDRVKKSKSSKEHSSPLDRLVRRSRWQLCEAVTGNTTYGSHNLSNEKKKNWIMIGLALVVIIVGKFREMNDENCDRNFCRSL